MNLTKANLVLGSLAVFVTLCYASPDYSIDWHKIASGSSTSTGGVYTVSGTLGQPDAGGSLTNGTFSVTGGFWSLLATVHTEGAPFLTITRTATNTVVVSWHSPSPGWNLQENASLIATNWSVPAESVTDNGTQKFIVVNPPAGQRFYRLQKP